MKRRPIKEVLVGLLLVTTLVVVGAQPASATTHPISTFAGTGSGGYSGDNGSATSAQINQPSQVTLDQTGNAYFTDYSNQRIRKISTTGIITTIAGTGSWGYSGDGGPATSAQIAHPEGIAVDAAGNVYFSDSDNSRIRKINTSGTISTFAGNGSSGYSGDNGPATSAQIAYVEDICLDAAGNLFIADGGNNVIRKVATNGTITTVAGNGASGYSGDNGPATGAKLNYPEGIGVDPAGNMYITDYNNTVRKVNNGGTITTIAGNGTSGFSGDGGPATSAMLNDPEDAIVDASGNLYIADHGNARVRMIDTNGTISTIAGNGSWGYTGDGGDALSADVVAAGLAFTSSGDLLIADWDESAIRKVTGIANGTKVSTVSTTVDASLTFTVAGRATVCNGQSGTNFQTSAGATTVSLGHLLSSNVGGGAQDLNVSTNAASGFTVYLRTSGTTPNSLRDGSGHSIADVSGTRAAPGSAPAAGTAGFGYTSSDTSTAFTSNKWAKLTNANDSVLIGSSGTTSKAACIGYEVAVAATTPAGVYSSNVAYTAVPAY